MGKRGQKRQRSAATSEQQQQQQRHQRATDHDARPATRQNVQITLSSHADQKHRRLSKRAQRRQHDRTTLKIDVSARLKASELTGAGLVRKLNLEIGKEEGEQSEDGGSDDNLYQSDEEEVEDWYEFYQMNHNPSSSPRSWSGREQLGSSRTAESGRQYRPELPRLGPTVYEPDSSELEELAKLQKKSQPVSSHPAQNIRRNRLPERRPLGPTVYECDSSELEELAKLQKKSQPIPARPAENTKRPRPPERRPLGPTVYECDSSELEELARLQKKRQSVPPRPTETTRRHRPAELPRLGPTVYECDSSELEELAKLQKKSQTIPPRPAENTRRHRLPERRPLGPTVYECDSSELEELAKLQKKRQFVPSQPAQNTRRHRLPERRPLGPTVYECDSSELEELAKLQKENKRTAESTKRHKPPKLPRLRPTTYEVNSSELAELQKESQRAAENTRRHKPAELPRLGPTVYECDSSELEELARLQKKRQPVPPRPTETTRRHRPAELPRLGPTVYECSSSGLAELAELEKEQQRLDAETLKIIHVSTKAKTVARQLLSSPNRTPQSGSEEPIEWPSSSPAHKTATVSSRTAVSLPYSPYPTKQPPSKKKPSRVLFTTPSGVNFYHRKYYGQSKVYNEWVPLTIADVLKLQEHKMVNTDDFFWKNHPIRNVFIVGLCVGVRQPKDDRVLYIDIDDASGHELVCKVKKRQPIDDHATRLLDMDTPFLIQAAGTIGIYTRGSERIRQLECDSSDRVTVIDDAHHEIRFLRKLLEMRKVLDVPWELSEEKCKEMDKQVFIN